MAAAMRIAPEHQRFAVFRLGRFLGVYGPGLCFIIPFVDRAVPVDLREQVRTIAAGLATTQDNARVSVDVTWRYRILDPAKSLLAVADLESALQASARAAIRAVVGNLTFSDVLYARESARSELHQRLRAATADWGVEVTQVDLGEIRRDSGTGQVGG